MNSLKFYIILLSLLTLAIITVAQEDSIFLGHGCQNATTSTLNSTYRANLNLLLSSLASNATRNNTIGFYNTSFGQNTDQVYGLFICRGDLSSTTVCQNCVTFATKDIVQRCPIGIASIVYYDACHLRYSNVNIFSKMDQSLFFSLPMSNAQNITNEPQRFNNLVGATVNDLAARAASAPPGAKKFAVNKTYFDAFQNIYSLAQCTPDLSSFDCNQCLSAAIAGLPNCCSGKIGGRVLFPSCYIRYEIYLFYNATAVARESPPPPPPPVALPSPPPPRSVTIPEGKVILHYLLFLSISLIPTLTKLITIECTRRNLNLSLKFFGWDFFFKLQNTKSLNYFGKQINPFVNFKIKLRYFFFLVGWYSWFKCDLTILSSKRHLTCLKINSTPWKFNPKRSILVLAQHFFSDPTTW